MRRRRNSSLERHLTMQGSFRKPELAAVDKVEVVDPLTVRLHAEERRSRR